MTPPPTDTWLQRVSQHDCAAFEIMSNHLSDHGIALIRDGYELNDNLKTHVFTSNNPTDRYLRHRSDLVGLYRKTRNFLIEIKSGDNKYPNFSIEADAFFNLKTAAQTNDRILSVMGFVNIETKECQAAWTLEIPDPYFIRVPRRFDADESFTRMCTIFQHANVSFCEYRGGSGTPFFLIKKDANYLRPLRQFIKEELAFVQATIPTSAVVNTTNSQQTLSRFFGVDILLNWLGAQS
jgi:hypothetical protein